jgi:peptidoglycan/LPS O-acetylase OafA/YrhL
MLLIYIGYYQYKHITYSTRQIWAELFFVQNFTHGIMGISWSLAIEEHFYLILVLLTVWALKKDWIRKQKAVVACCIGIALICLGLRTWLSYSRPFDVYTHFFPTYLRLDALFFGVLLSWFYQFRPVLFNNFFIRYRVPLLLCIPAGLSVPFLLNIENPLLLSIGLTIIYSCCGAGIGVMLAARRHWNHPAWRPVIYIGKCSYSIYLVHLLVGPAVAHFFTQRLFTESSPYAYIAIYLLANITSGILLSLWVEQFFLRWRDRWFPK